MAVSQFMPFPTEGASTISQYTEPALKRGRSDDSTLTGTVSFGNVCSPIAVIVSRSVPGTPPASAARITVTEFGLPIPAESPKLAD